MFKYLKGLLDSFYLMFHEQLEANEQENDESTLLFDETCESDEIESNKFAFNNKITNIIFTPKSKIKKINSYAFSHCSKLKTVVLSGGILILDEGSFFNCHMLDFVTFNQESNLIIIGKKCFQGTQIMSFPFPNSLKLIDDNAFLECHFENSFIDLSNTNLDYIGFRSIVGDRKTLTIKIPYFTKCAIVNQSVIYVFNEDTSKFNKYNDVDLQGIVHMCSKQGIVSIHRYMRKVWLRRDVKRVLSYAFAHTHLSNITIPCSVEEIGVCAFRNCCFLGKVRFMENSQLKIIKTAAFQNCASLKKFLFPPSLEVLEINVFHSCTCLETVKFSKDSKLKKITHCFTKCLIKHLSLPSSIEEIQGNIFAEMTYLKAADIKSNLFQIKNNFLLSKDGKELFGCFPSTSITIPEGVRVIKEKALYGSNAKQIILPSSLEILENESLHSWSMFIGMNITFNGNSLIEIGEYVFTLMGLGTLKLPSSVRKIHINAFSASSIDRIIINNDYFKTSADGVVYSLNPPGIVFCPYNVKMLRVPYNLEMLYSNSLQYANIDKVILPKTLKEVGKYVFGEKIGTIVIPKPIIPIIIQTEVPPVVNIEII